HRAGVHAHVPTQYRVAYHAAGQDAPARHGGVDSLPAPAVVVEGELGGGIGVAGGAQRPLAVVEVEGRAHRAQVHVGLVVRVESPHVAPVCGRVRRFARDVIRLEIVGVHVDAMDQRREDVPPEVVGTLIAERVGV